MRKLATLGGIHSFAAAEKKEIDEKERVREIKERIRGKDKKKERKEREKLRGRDSERD